MRRACSSRSGRRPGPGQGLHQPERADVEGALLTGQPVGVLLDVVAVYQAVAETSPLPAASVDGVERLSMRGSVGDTKKTSGIIRLEASSMSLP